MERKVFLKKIKYWSLVLLLTVFIKTELKAQAPPNCPAATGFPSTGQIFVVTRTDDWPDENNSPVVGQLRWAIAQANRCRPIAGGRHIIQFNIPGPGPYLFKPFIMYPRIQSSVTIDGFSQPGSSYGNPMIVIDGSYASAGGVRSVNYTAEGYGSYSADFSSSSDKGRCFEENYDYTLGGSGTAIIWRGLVLNNFKTTAPLVQIGAIHMNTGSGFVVEGCFIGTDQTGNIAVPNDAGITVNSPGNCSDPLEGNHIIGSTDPNLKNIISGNNMWGIQIMKTFGIQVLNNYIGVAKDGSPLGNGENGIRMWLWNFAVIVKGNRIENNSGNGIALWYAGASCGGDNVYNSRFEGNSIKYNTLNGMSFLNSQVYDHVVGVDVSGVGVPNDISYNGQNGVYVAEWWNGSSYAGGASRTVQIRKNKIVCNGQKPINLNYGSSNPGNQNIQKPVINTTFSTTATIIGTAPANKLIDLYAMSLCANCSVSGSQGDGWAWIGSTVSDGVGNWSISGSFNGQVSATATDNVGATNSRNTSEFSSCLYVNALPVKFLQFTATKSNEEALLEWSTATEKNNAYFEIQRSIDGIYFETIKIVSATGNAIEVQSYSCLDSEISEGEIYYYKIKQVDADGQFSFSTTISIDLNGDEEVVHLYPNPASDNIELKLSSGSIVSIALYDLLGRALISINDIHTHSYKLMISEMATGIYVLKINTDKNKSYQEKIYKK